MVIINLLLFGVQLRYPMTHITCWMPEIIDKILETLIEVIL